jgi:hypothetical protein
MFRAVWSSERRSVEQIPIDCLSHSHVLIIKNYPLTLQTQTTFPAKVMTKLKINKLFGKGANVTRFDKSVFSQSVPNYAGF